MVYIRHFVSCKKQGRQSLHCFVLV